MESHNTTTTWNIFGNSDEGVRASFAVLEGSSGLQSIINLMQFAISFMARFAAALCVLMIVYAGFRMLLALGDQDKMKSATSIIRNALMGLFIAIIAELIVQLTILFGSNLLS